QSARDLLPTLSPNLSDWRPPVPVPKTEPLGEERSSGIETNGLTPLRAILPSIGLTKRKLKQLESIHLVRQQRAIGRQELAFNARPFVLCGLPLRRPPSTQPVHRSRNGKFFLHIVAHPEF